MFCDNFARRPLFGHFFFSIFQNHPFHTFLVSKHILMHVKKMHKIEHLLTETQRTQIKILLSIRYQKQQNVKNS